jgi:hypothetical protein
MNEEFMEQKKSLFLLVRKDEEYINYMWNLDESSNVYDTQELADAKLNEINHRGKTMKEEGWLIVHVSIVFTPVS